MQNDTQDVRRGWTSASNAQADLECPGRHLMQKGLLEVKTEDAERGTLIHAALTKNDPAGLDAEGQEMYRSCVAIRDERVVQFFGPHATEAMQRSWREQRYWVLVPKNGTGLEHSGTPDIVYRFGVKALIVDYKTGKNETPSSPRNLQLRDLAVLVRGHFLVEQVGVVVVQPLVTHSPEIALYETADLARAAEEMFARVVRSNDPVSPRIAGETQCRYCRAKMKCPEYQRWSGSMVPKMDNLVNISVADWTPAQRAIFCERKAQAQSWLDEVEKAMKAFLIADPEAIPGWYLKEGAKKETITDPQGVFDRFAAVGGQLSEFMACIAVTKTKLKEKVATMSGAKGKALDSAMDALTEGLVTSSQNAPSLAKKKDI